MTTWANQLLLYIALVALVLGIAVWALTFATPRISMQCRALSLDDLQIVYTGRMPSADTTTVRLRRPDSERLSALAKSKQKTVVDVLHDAIDALERQEFLRGLSEDHQRLSPAEREALLAERLAWDQMA